ncbi:MAG: OmpA family protein, partial [Bacteroidales bacterium]|nr:OmpA family protein [Bacteroidales bacterium]
NPTFGLQIEGYVADDEGSEMEQRDLAQRRAYMVSKIFIEKGVPENQISTVTYTINDPRNSQNIPDVSKDEHRAAIFRILVN